jgi:tetratricopeptide (TPR) repeat protein
LRKLDRLDEALAVYGRAKEIEPEVGGRYIYLAVVLCELRRYDEAEAAARKAIELWPSFGPAFEIQGLISRSQGRFAEAIDALEQSVRLKPLDARVASDLASLLTTCADARLRNGVRAVELSTQAIALEPANARHSRVLAATHYRAGDWQAALDALQLAAELDSDARGIDWFFAAMAHRQLGDEVAARAAYERGCEWMTCAGSDDQDAYRLREEAAGLLEIEIR